MKIQQQVYATLLLLVFGLSSTLFVLSGAEAQQPAWLPVPREQAVIVETDVDPAVFDKANPFIPGGTQWGSGWHQNVVEWDWYINYVTGEYILWRISGWEYKDNFRTFILRIRDGVKWNDGVQYTAEDVVFSVELQKQYFPTRYVALNVESARAIDKLTVELRLKEPNPRFHHVFRMWGPNGEWVRPKHIWEGKDPLTFANWPPVETGPYKLWKVFPDLKMYVWERVEDYWGKQVHGVFPGPKYVVWRRAPPADIDLADFLRGDVDSPIPFLFTVDMIKTAKAAGVPMVDAPFPDPVPFGIQFNMARYPLSLREVRWAIAYLTNKEKVASLYPVAEQGIPAKYMHADWGALKKYEYADIYEKYKFMVEYNPAKAEELLKGLGFEKGPDGVWVTPNGTRLSFTILAWGPPSVENLIANVLADELNRFGIEAAVITPSFATREEMRRVGNFWIDVEVSHLPHGMWLSGDIFEGAIRHHSTIRGEECGKQFCSPRLDQIVDTLKVRDPDDPNNEPLYREIVEMFLRELPYLPVVEKIFQPVFSTKYWVGWPTTENMYIIPYNWWPQLIFILFNLKPAPPPPPPPPPQEVTRIVTQLVTREVVTTVVAGQTIVQTVERKMEVTREVPVEVVPQWVFGVVAAAIIIAVAGVAAGIILRRRPK